MDRRTGIYLRALAAALALIVLVSLPPTASARATAPSSHGDVSPDMRCNDALYRFLPGAVNYCLGVRALARGHHASARQLLRLAAGWGDKRAQYLLGILYFNGEHVPADRPLGLAWLALAAERNVPLYRATYGSALHESSAAEHRQAQAELERLLPVYADAVATARAEKHFQRQVALLDAWGAPGATLCMAGLTGGYLDRSDPSMNSCPSMTAVHQTLERYADHFFQRWQGHVTVAPLQEVAPPPRR